MVVLVVLVLVLVLVVVAQRRLCVTWTAFLEVPYLIAGDGE